MTQVQNPELNKAAGAESGPTAKAQKVWYPEINIMRAVLVILVVVGHVLSQQITDDNDVAFRYSVAWTVIYSFHMQAFFVISGFLAVKSINPGKKTSFVFSRFRRLMVPYLVMSLVYLPFRIRLDGLARSDYQAGNFWRIILGESPDGALWFLYVLFVLSIVTSLFVRRRTIPAFLVLSIALYLTAAHIPEELTVAGELLRSFFFYLLGILCRFSYDRSKKYILHPAVLIASGLVFTIGNYYFIWYPDKNLYLLTGVAGTILVLALAVLVCRVRGPIFSLLDKIGNYGMDIYIFSEPVKVISRTLLQPLPDFACTLLVTALSIAIPMLLSEFVIRRVNILCLLFLGRSKSELRKG